MSDPKTIEIEELDELSDDLSNVSWLDLPVLLIFFLLIILVFLQFFTRYVLNDSLSWTEEASRYLLIAMTFIGGITCMRTGTNIYLEFFYRYLSPKTAKFVSIIVELINFGFLAYIGYLAFQLAAKTSHQRMSSIDLPKSIIFQTVGIACFGMAIYAAIHFVQYFREDPEKIKSEKLGNY